MRRKLLVIFAGGVLGIAAGIATAIVARGEDWALLMLTVAAVIYVVPLLAVGAAVAWGIAGGVRHRRAWIWASRIMVSLAVGIGAFAVTSIPLGRLILRKDIMRAELYGKGLALRLDHYRRKTGTYPETIDSLLPEDRPVPRLLRREMNASPGHAFYHCADNAFTLQFIVDDSLFGTVHVYRGDKGTWEVFSD